MKKYIPIMVLLIFLSSYVSAATMGYTSQGGSTDYDSYYVGCSSFTNTVGNGTVISLHAYLEEFDDDLTPIQLGIYNSSKDMIDNATGYTMLNNFSGWINMSTAKTVHITNNTVYWLCFHGTQGYVRYYFDGGTSVTGAIPTKTRCLLL